MRVFLRDRQLRCVVLRYMSLQTVFRSKNKSWMSDWDRQTHCNAMCLPVSISHPGMFG